MSDDKCYKPDMLPIPEGFSSKAEDILSKLGYDQECIKSASQAFAEMQAGAEIGALGAGAKSYWAGSAGYNEMQQRGCGSIMSNLTKIAKLTAQAQCIMRKNSQDLQINVTNKSTISVKTVEPEGERELKQKALDLYTIKQPAEPVFPTKDLIGDYKKLVEILGKDLAPSFDSFSKTYDVSYQQEVDAYYKRKKDYDELLRDLPGLNQITGELIDKMFNHDIDFNNVTITQIIDTKIKGNINVTGKELEELTSTMDSITDIVSQMKIDKQLGLGALEASTKQQNTTETAESTNINQQSISQKIQNTKFTQTSDGVITLQSAGAITLKNVTLSTHLITDINLDILLESAVSSGLASAIKTLTTSRTEMEDKSKSAGIEDMIKAIKDGQAKVAEAGSINPMNLLISGIVAVVVLCLLIIGAPRLAKAGFGKIFSIIPDFSSDSPGRIVLKMFFILLIIVLCFIPVIINFFNKPQQTIEYPATDSLGQTSTPQELSQYLRRDVKLKDDPALASEYNKVYNSVWKGLGCTENLTTELIDYKKWDFKSDEIVADEMQTLIDQTTLCDNYKKENDICKFKFDANYAGKKNYDGYKRSGYNFDITKTCFATLPTTPSQPPATPPSSMKIKKIQFGFFKPTKQFLHFAELQGHYLDISKQYKNTEMIPAFDPTNNSSTKYNFVGKIYNADTKDPSKLYSLYGVEKIGDRNIDTFFHSTDDNEVKYVEIILPNERAFTKFVVANRQDKFQERIIGAQIKAFNGAGLLVFQSKPITVARKTYMWTAPFTNNGTQEDEEFQDVEI